MSCVLYSIQLFFVSFIFVLLLWAWKFNISFIRRADTHAQIQKLKISFHRTSYINRKHFPNNNFRFVTIYFWCCCYFGLFSHFCAHAVRYIHLCRLRSFARSLGRAESCCWHISLFCMVVLYCIGIAFGTVVVLLAVFCFTFFRRAERKNMINLIMYTIYFIRNRISPQLTQWACYPLNE